ncbi:MAG: Thiol-disulfide oxidoreductase ResA [Candidatus Hydrogenedentota bacterium]|jgi:protocatechuate 3,4-dioxygenase beta subunit
MRIKTFLHALLLAFLCCVPAHGNGFVLSGRVLQESDGTPVNGAEVWLSQEGLAVRAATNSQGQYSLPGANAGAFHVVALHSGHAIAGHTGFLTASAVVDLVLPPAEDVSLKVIGPSSKAVSGARLTWLNVNGLFNVPVAELGEAGFPQYRSNGEGMITLPPLPSGGFVRLRLSQFDHADLMVDYLPVKQEQPALQMAHGVAVAGKVMAPDGTPAPGAMVRLFQVGVAGQREFASAASDPEGYFRCRVPSGEYLVAVRHADFASPPPQPVLARGEDSAEVLLQLERARRITGQVLLPDGAPCGGVYVAYLKGETIYEEVFTGADGGFHLRVASPDGVLRVVPPDGYVTQQLSDIVVAMEDADKVVLNPIQLREVPRLKGRVLDASGEPVAGALVSTPRLGRPERAVSDADGRFEIRPRALPDEGALYFVVEHPLRFERAEFLAEFADSQEVEVRLKAYTPSPELPDEPEDAPKIPRPLVGETAPAWNTAQWFNSEPLTLEALKGKVVVMAFWASFDDSPQGLDVVDLMRQLHTAYAGDAQVSIVSLHDATSTVEEVEAFNSSVEPGFPIGLDNQRFETFSAYKVTFIPDLVLIDKKGKLRYRQPGEKLEEYIKILRRE